MTFRADKASIGSTQESLLSRRLRELNSLSRQSGSGSLNSHICLGSRELSSDVNSSSGLSKPTDGRPGNAKNSVFMAVSMKSAIVWSSSSSAMIPDLFVFDYLDFTEFSSRHGGSTWKMRKWGKFKLHLTFCRAGQTDYDSFKLRFNFLLIFPLFHRTFLGCCPEWTFWGFLNAKSRLDMVQLEVQKNTKPKEHNKV